MSPESRRNFALSIGALGVVFGDIATSPLYTFQECVGKVVGASSGEAAILGVLSLVFWALTLVVSVKYVAVLMRLDSDGEGGIMALLAQLPSNRRSPSGRALAPALVIAMAGAALLYGDAVITPAISVLSAVEGIAVANPRLAQWVVPTTVGILTALFAVQRGGPGSSAAISAR